MITQGIVSKIMEEKGIFLTTAAVNSGNSGGPIFNLNGKLVGISFASVNKEAFLKKFNISVTDLGLGISSSMIKKGNFGCQTFANKKGSVEAVLVHLGNAVTLRSTTEI